MAFLRHRHLVSLLSLKIPLTIILSTFVLIASLDHVLQYTASVMDRPCRSSLLEDTSFCRLLLIPEHHHGHNRDASLPLNLATISLLMDDAVGLAKSAGFESSSLKVQLAKAIQEYEALSGDHQGLRAHAKRIFHQ